MKEDKQTIKIKLTEEAIRQLNEDLNLVKTDWGRSVIIAELDKLEKELLHTKTDELFVGDKVRITDAMDSSFIDKVTVIEEVCGGNPTFYKLDIAGGYWMGSCLEKVE